ncbi:ATP-binding protein [Oceanidesulfovibrio indonesiensis]|uniref:ATP-binding protein n=1 Tax=Oceanidesulfovibrio indonesiensis TaxID=54767 RepID=A0A7M3MJX0_9BACT|nr:ATP-binding protein [Oceanidesulfovibrio indonesiensis]TVM19980.1 ATP-binding protein [Oceanidesulfovibrio indonesiensis]
MSPDDKQNVRFLVKEQKCDFGSSAGQLEEFARRHGLSDRLAYQMTLVVDEVVTNTAKYGYGDCSQHCINVDLHLEGNVLVILIKDKARPFDLTTAPVPELDIPVEQRRKPVGGMGIHLVRNLVDSIEYRRENGMNVLEIHKTIDPDEFVDRQ